MSAFLRLEIWSNFQGAGGLAVRDVGQLAECKAQFTVEAPEQNSLTFAVPRSWEGLSDITPRRVARVVFADGSFDEWRLNVNHRATLGGDGLKRITCLPPIYLLAECGLYYTTGAGGIRDFTYSLAGVTPTQAITSLVLGAPDCPGFITLGTVDAAVDAATLDALSGEDRTPLAILLAIRDAVKAKGQPCELSVTRNSTVGYKINLVASVGSAAAVPEFRAGKNIVSYLLAYNSTRQTTRIEPRGPVDATGAKARLSRARFKVTAVNGGTKRLTVADDASGAGPIAFNEQYVGQFLFREKTGRTFQVVHSYKATQEFELADVSTFAAHTVGAPEWISLRESEPLTGTRRVGAKNGYLAQPFEVTAVGGGTLTIPSNFAGAAPFPVDHAFVDWYLRRAAFVMSTTSGGSMVVGRLDVVSVAGVQVNDLVLGGNAGTPHGGSPVMVVTGIDTINKYLFVSSRDGYPLGTWGAVTFRVYRPVATLHRVVDSVAATNVATVDAVGTAAANDLVEIIQPCQGVLPTWIESPGDRSAYGKKISVLASPYTGEANLLVNPVMRTYTGASSAPDGWVWSGTGVATIARSAAPPFTPQGGFAALCVFASAGALGVLTTPAAYVSPITGAMVTSVRARVYFTAFDPGEEWAPTFSYVYLVRSTCTARLYQRDAAGADMGIAGASVVMGCPGFANGVALNTLFDVEFHGVDLSLLTAGETLVVKFTADWGGSISGGLIKGYVDGVQITQTPTAPNPLPALLTEYPTANKLLQAANLELLNYAPPLKELTCSGLDLEKLDPANNADDLVTLGGNVRVVHPDEAVDETVRLVSLGVDYLNRPASTFMLSVLQKRFTNLVQAA